MDVRWSADGKTLAVSHLRYPPKGVFVLANFITWIELMDLNGKNRRKIELPFKKLHLCDWRLTCEYYETIVREIFA